MKMINRSPIFTLNDDSHFYSIVNNGSLSYSTNTEEMKQKKTQTNQDYYSDINNNQQLKKKKLNETLNYDLNLDKAVSCFFLF